MRLDGVKGATRGRARGMVLPFQPLALTFHHVNYYVNMPKARCHGKRWGLRARPLLRSAETRLASSQLCTLFRICHSIEQG